ncbi:transporter substrate-binding domain-containing protein [Hahella ganghwensis]|uniref:transporter substrate-binding domain-containing protein n=1 Tax=Hahella ganghwensis TaxID=286420 RepID=UPI0012FA6A7A|nr:hypothetical protein [Hahella ganghwensis]
MFAPERHSWIPGCFVGLINVGGDFIKLVYLIMLIPVPQAQADSTLRFSYGSHYGPPYMVKVMKDGDKKAIGGLLYELGLEIARRLGVKPEFAEVPRKRLARWLLNGKVHAYCERNPLWVDEADQLLWSDPVYQSSDIYLVRQDYPEP